MIDGNFLRQKNEGLKGLRVVHGRGRGSTIGVPTINVDFSNIPQEMERGIYACWIVINNSRYPGALHYGPRPAFQDTETMEIHVIDKTISYVPDYVDLEIVGKIREVKNFESTPDLLKAIEEDIRIARGMLGV